MTKNSKVLSVSKCQAYFECPFKAYLKFHKWIVTAEVNESLKMGTEMHKAVETLLLYGEEKALAYTEQFEADTKKKYIEMLDAFRRTFKPNEKEIISVETPITYGIKSKHFKSFIVKADMIFKENGNLFFADLKTTSKYGMATSAHYLNSLQIIIYYYILNQIYPNNKGTKIYVVRAPLKTQPATCFEETIIFNTNDIKRAEKILQSIIQQIDKIEKKKKYEKNYYHCKQFAGRECEYYNICYEMDAKKKNLDEVLNRFMEIGYIKIEDTEEYLGIGRRQYENQQNRKQ